MSNSTSKKPTTIFWVITAAALLWNIMGVVAYLAQAYMTDEALASLPEAEQAYFNNVPAWVTASFAISVFAGTLGCSALVFLKKWGIWLFILSFITVIAQFVYNVFIQKDMVVTGNHMIMPIVIVSIATFLVLFSKDSESIGYIS